MKEEGVPPLINRKKPGPKGRSSSKYLIKTFLLCMPGATVGQESSVQEHVPCRRCRDATCGTGKEGHRAKGPSRLALEELFLHRSVKHLPCAGHMPGSASTVHAAARSEPQRGHWSAAPNTNGTASWPQTFSAVSVRSGIGCV